MHFCLYFTQKCIQLFVANLWYVGIYVSFITGLVTQCAVHYINSWGMFSDLRVYEVHTYCFMTSQHVSLKYEMIFPRPLLFDSSHFFYTLQKQIQKIQRIIKNDNNKCRKARSKGKKKTKKHSQCLRFLHWSRVQLTDLSTSFEVGCLRIYNSSTAVILWVTLYPLQVTIVVAFDIPCKFLEREHNKHPIRYLETLLSKNSWLYINNILMLLPTIWPCN